MVRLTAQQRSSAGSGQSVSGLCDSPLATAYLAGRGVYPATGLRWLLDRWKARAVASRVLLLDCFLHLPPQQLIDPPPCPRPGAVQGTSEGFRVRFPLPSRNGGQAPTVQAGTAGVLAVLSCMRGHGPSRYELGTATRERLAPISAGHRRSRRVPAHGRLGLADRTNTVIVAQQ